MVKLDPPRSPRTNPPPQLWVQDKPRKNHDQDRPRQP